MNKKNADTIPSEDSVLSAIINQISDFYDFYGDADVLQSECWNIAVMLQTSNSFSFLDDFQKANILYLLKMIPVFSKATYEFVGRDIQHYTYSS